MLNFKEPKIKILNAIECLGFNIKENENEVISSSSNDIVVINSNDVTILDTMNIDNEINPETVTEITPGLIFENLIVNDVEESASKDNPYTIPLNKQHLESQPIALKDNSELIKLSPELSKIQDIIRSIPNYDVEMVELYNSFVICLILIEGVQIPSKSLLVDYNGSFMNQTPKIVLFEDSKYLDECNIIHINDVKNIISHLNGNPIIIPKNIVSQEKRIITRYIINYGSKILPEKEKKEFEKICISKIIPFIINEIVGKNNPDVSFRISEFSSPYNWTLICDKNTPYRFGEVENLSNKVIYLKGTGKNPDGSIEINYHDKTK